MISQFLFSKSHHYTRCAWYCSSIIMSILFCACESKPTLGNGEIATPVQQLTDSTSRLVHVNKEGDSAFWPLPYPVYHAEVSDIDGNGTKEILVGVIKSTRFDTIKAKRVFVFKIIDDHIRPLWLGSRLGMPIEDFTIHKVDSTNRLFTIEHEPSKDFAVGEYEWDRFGFKFIRYVARNCSFREAKSYLNEP